MQKQQRVQRLKKKRDSRYSISLAKELCIEIACSDQSVATVCRSNKKFPDYKTVYRWIAEHEEFKKLYLDAKRLQTLFLTDQIHDIAKDGALDYEMTPKGNLRFNIENVHRSKLRIDTIKWHAAKLMAKQFGDKIINNTETADGEKQLKAIAIVPAELSIDEWMQSNLATTTGASDKTTDMPDA